MSLVSASEVMGMPSIVGAHTEDEVQLALDWAAESIESYCERKFGYVAADVVDINPYRGDGGRATALLPNPPVWNVGSVLAQMPGGNGLQWVNLQYWQSSEDGLLFDTSKYFGMFGVTGSSFWSGVANADGFFDYGSVPSWPSTPRSLRVTYTHGYATFDTGPIDGVKDLPQGIVSAVIRGAALYLTNPEGAVEKRVGELTNRYPDPSTASGNSGFLGGWMDTVLLGEYRLVHL